MSSDFAYNVTSVPLADVYDYLAKVIVVGDAGVGKSSLITQYAKGEYNHDAVSTVGIDFASVCLEVKHKTDKDDTYMYKYQLWDCAGQERYFAIVKSYFQNANVILYVFDITDRLSYANLGRWIKCANEYKSSSDPKHRITIVVGNKGDLFKERCVTYDEAETFANTIDGLYFEVSAKQKKEVNRLFESIALELHDKVIGGHITDLTTMSDQDAFVRMKPSQPQRSTTSSQQQRPQTPRRGDPRNTDDSALATRCTNCTIL